MVGNDVVDLRDSDARPESFRARFDDRVFSVEEQRAIAQDSNPLARRWAHWGAKEAAYKLAKQLDSRFVFTPGRLVADYVDDENDLEVSRRVAPRPDSVRSSRATSSWERRRRGPASTWHALRITPPWRGLKSTGEG